MKPPRGLLRYGLYVFIAAWMFALGVVVGRGTSPVTFDTANFQERLRVIVGEIPKEAPETQKVDLDFYDALNKSGPQDTVVADLPLQAPAPQAPPVKVEKQVPGPQVAAAEIPVKQSLKRATLGRDLEGKTETAEKKKSVDGGGAVPVPKPAAAAGNQDPSGGKYTIQVAAYRAFKDAVSQMSALKEKGFSSYRTKAESNGTTWYRVRTGSFSDFQSAQAELGRLKKARINGMIIKKEEE